jgi:hypothetical protein
MAGRTFKVNEPLNRSRRRESALTFFGLKVRGLTSAATRFTGRLLPTGRGVMINDPR